MWTAGSTHPGNPQLLEEKPLLADKEGLGLVLMVGGKQLDSCRLHSPHPTGMTAAVAAESDQVRSRINHGHRGLGADKALHPHQLVV